MEFVNNVYIFNRRYLQVQARPEVSSDSQGDEGPEPFRHEEGPGQKPYEKYRPS